MMLNVKRDLIHLGIYSNILNIKIKAEHQLYDFVVLWPAWVVTWNCNFCAILRSPGTLTGIIFDDLWTLRPQPEAKSVPSLLQIQLEQEKQLREGGSQPEKSHLLSTKVAEAPFGGGSSGWKASAQPAVQWNKAGNSSRNTWTPAAEPAEKKKPSVPADRWVDKRGNLSTDPSLLGCY